MVLSFKKSIFVIFISLLVIIYLRLRDKDFYYLALKSRSEKRDWIGEGNFDFSQAEKSFYITASASGVIYSKCLTWSNYKMSFKFKIINKCLGIVVRAINLSNYLMFQCSLQGINPHIRINALWFVQKHNDMGVDLSFSKPLSKDKWYKGIFICENRTIKILILEDKNKIFDREWTIPSDKIFHYKEAKDSDEKKIIFPVDLDYGTIGFRNYGDEKALIKDLLIEKI